MKRITFPLLATAVMLLSVACEDESVGSVTSEASRRLATLPPGQVVTIVVRDTGCYNDDEYRFEITGGDSVSIEVQVLDNLDPTAKMAGTIQLPTRTVARIDRGLDTYRSASPSSHYACTIDVDIAWANGEESLQVSGLWIDLPWGGERLSLFALAEMAGVEGGHRPYAARR